MAKSERFSDETLIALGDDAGRLVREVSAKHGTLIPVFADGLVAYKDPKTGDIVRREAEGVDATADLRDLDAVAEVTHTSASKAADEVDA